MKFPPLVHNRVSYAGAVVALLALIAIVFLFIVNTLVGAGEAPYAGLVIFLLLPAFLLLGLVLIPVGMLIERRHLRRTGAFSIPRFPIIDLNNARQRNAVLVFSVGSLVLLFLTVFGSYQVYEATESVAFCGSTCHTVMEPEKVAHQRSAHARVRCVECHVGPGVDWYFQSKLSGAHQVYAVLTDSYPRPIPVPLTSLRPARETCEHCHWAEQHGGVQRLKRRVAFLPDEENTRWEIDLLVDVGGGERGAEGAGIHWHLNPANRVEYIASDESRQEIPWIRVTDLGSGKVTEYASTESPLSADQVAAAAPRQMDCLDCHNRPSHRFDAPGEGIDRALQRGDIDASLPFVKARGSELLAAEYGSVAEAETAIDSGLREFYSAHHPDVARDRASAVDQASAALQDIYRANFFPAMRVRWDAYPEHSSHFRFPGCFRCHDGLHESADGDTVSAECTTCHVITAQGPSGDMRRSKKPEGLAFEHPPIKDLEDAWQDTPCTDCHAAE